MDKPRWLTKTRRGEPAAWVHTGTGKRALFRGGARVTRGIARRHSRTSLDPEGLVPLRDGDVVDDGWQAVVFLGGELVAVDHDMWRRILGVRISEATAWAVRTVREAQAAKARAAREEAEAEARRRAAQNEWLAANARLAEVVREAVQPLIERGWKLDEETKSLLPPHRWMYPVPLAHGATGGWHEGEKLDRALAEAYAAQVSAEEVL